MTWTEIEDMTLDDADLAFRAWQVACVAARKTEAARSRR